MYEKWKNIVLFRWTKSPRIISWKIYKNTFVYFLRFEIVFWECDVTSFFWINVDPIKKNVFLYFKCLYGNCESDLIQQSTDFNFLQSFYAKNNSEVDLATVESQKQLFCVQQKSCSDCLSAADYCIW